MNENYQVKLLEVNISTINMCTRKCPYCKFGQVSDQSEIVKIMSEELFEKILWDLREVDFSGIVSPFEGNEPLLDSRIFQFVNKISCILPNAQSFIFSNGDLATKDDIKTLFDCGLQKFFFSLHDLKNLEKAIMIQKQHGEEKVVITKEYELDKRNIFHNFAGAIKSSIVSQNRYLNNGCYLPFRQMVINPDGFLDLCCADIADQYVFQNAKEKSIVEIFYHDPNLNLIRKSLSQNNRSGLKPCENCSFFGYPEPLSL